MVTERKLVEKGDLTFKQEEAETPILGLNHSLCSP